MILFPQVAGPKSSINVLQKAKDAVNIGKVVSALNKIQGILKVRSWIQGGLFFKVYYTSSSSYADLVHIVSDTLSKSGVSSPILTDWILAF